MCITDTLPQIADTLPWNTDALSGLPDTLPESLYHELWTLYHDWHFTMDPNLYQHLNHHWH